LCLDDSKKDSVCSYYRKTILEVHTLEIDPSVYMQNDDEDPLRRTFSGSILLSHPGFRRMSNKIMHRYQK
jgi:hypothetical protein